MFFYSLVSMVISYIMLMINMLIMTKKSYKEKMSTFECGFDPKSKSRLPFSMHFFLVAMIFLIFDVEITMILPMPIMKNVMNLNLWVLINLFFIIILLVGTIHEWIQGSLQWATWKESYWATSFDLVMGMLILFPPFWVVFKM